MLRYTLAIYLLLINLTGPSPCCCTIARFLAAVSGEMLPTSSCGPGAFSCCSGASTPAPITNAPNRDHHRSTGHGSPQHKCHCGSLVSVEADAPITITPDQSRAWLDDMAGVMDIPTCFEICVSSFCLDHRSTDQPTAVFSGRDTRVAMSSLLC